MGYNPTDEQVAIMDAIKTGGNVTISAGAGAGKTTTLVQAAASVPQKLGTFTAFNRKIIDDSRGKFGQNVRCATTHSLATSVLHADGGWRRNRLQAPFVYGRQLAQMLRINDPIPLGQGRFLHPSVLASLARGMVDRWANTADERIGWWHLPYRPGLEDRDLRKVIGTALVPAANIAWADITNPKGRLRYTHDYYRKEWALTHPRLEGDFLMVDEAQDSAGVMVGIVEDQITYGMQIITVGDKYQAINGWTGAVDAMDKFGGIQLQLTQSFRFGPAIAEEANKWLTLLNADLRIKGFDKVPSVVTSQMVPDAILCRTNGAAVAAVMDYQASGKRVGLLGDAKAIIKLAEGARDLQEKGWTGHPDLMAFPSWATLQDYVENDPAGGDLKVFVDLVDRHGVDAIEQAMTNLSQPRYAEITLSTAHKCKGAEWDNVRIGTDFRRPKADDNGVIMPARDLAMLSYVAVTRAKVTLDRGSLEWVDEALASVAVGGIGTVKEAPLPAAAPEPIVVQAPELPECGEKHPKYTQVWCTQKGPHEIHHDAIREAQGNAMWDRAGKPVLRTDPRAEGLLGKQLISA